MLNGFGNGKKGGLGLRVGHRYENPEIAAMHWFVLLGQHQAHAGARANFTLTGVKEIDQESDAHQLQAENDRHPVQREKQDQVGATGCLGNIASPASGDDAML